MPPPPSSPRPHTRGRSRAARLAWAPGARRRRRRCSGELVASGAGLALTPAVLLPRVAGVVVAIAVELDGEALLGPAAVDPPPAGGAVVSAGGRSRAFAQRSSTALRACSARRGRHRAGPAAAWSRPGSLGAARAPPRPSPASCGGALRPRGRRERGRPRARTRRDRRVCARRWSRGCRARSLRPRSDRPTGSLTPCDSPLGRGVHLWWGSGALTTPVGRQPPFRSAALPHRSQTAARYRASKLGARCPTR